MRQMDSKIHVIFSMTTKEQRSSGVRCKRKHKSSGREQSWLKGRAEAAEVKLLKSILHSASTNVLHSDWGQSDRQRDLPLLHPTPTQTR